MVVYGQPSHNLFLLTDWQVILTVKDPFYKNINKNYIAALPGFDIQEFPFLLMSGDRSFNLLNVQNGHIEPFINAPNSVKDCQQAFCFTESKKGNRVLHFSTTNETGDQINQFWYRMRLKKDLIEVLQENGRLPVGS